MERFNQAQVVARHVEIVIRTMTVPGS